MVGQPKVGGLSEIRAGLLEAWAPTVHEASLTRVEQANLAELWHEIVLVEAAGAWSALSALAGQTLEALLKRKLDALPDLSVSGNTMYPAADAWRRHVAKAAPNTLLVASSVVSAVQLRNWASHRDLRYRGASELRATQSLALLICLREALYPAKPAMLGGDRPAVHSLDHHWWLEHYASQRSDVLNDWLAQKAVHLDEQELPATAAVAVLAHALRHGSARSQLGTIRAAERAPQLLTSLPAAIHMSFAGLIQRAAGSRVRDVEELVGKLSQLDLKVHARVLASTLPFDGFTLSSFLPNSVATLVRYVGSCRFADENVFRAVLERDQELTLVADELAGLVSRIANEEERQDRDGRKVKYACNIGNMGLLLESMPLKVRTRYLSRLHLRHHAIWVASQQPRAYGPYISVVSPLLNKPQAQSVHASMIEGVEACKLDANLDALFQLSRQGVLATELGQAVARALLGRVVATWPPRGDQLIWDAAASGTPDLEHQAKQLAINRLGRGDVDAATRLALLGILRVLAAKNGQTELPEVAAACAQGGSHAVDWQELVLADRWRLFRSVVGASQADADDPVPMWVLDHLRQRRNAVRLRSTATESTKTLLTLVDAILAKRATGPA